MKLAVEGGPCGCREQDHTLAPRKMRGKVARAYLKCTKITEISVDLQIEDGIHRFFVSFLFDVYISNRPRPG